MYREEHPKPQARRADWMNLNGTWQFERDDGNSGVERGLADPQRALAQTIEVPFCPESRLSGIGHTDFMASVWYKREVALTAAQVRGCVRLHFGAADYETTVYVNGRECGTHRGGYVSFWMDVTDAVREGVNVITVHVTDDTRHRGIPSGKQSGRYASYGCFYTRTTGIWQTVWLEFLPTVHLQSWRYYPDTATQALTVEADTVGAGRLTVEAFFEGRPMGRADAVSRGGHLWLTVPLAEAHVWDVGQGALYDLTLTYGDDRVESYVGLRDIAYREGGFWLNGRPVFQRLVLDQGFYPDGIYTAPSDEALAADIDRSMAMGFNGARLHEKIFEERFLYHCDRKGYLVWGEYPNWGLDVSYADAVYGMLPEWLAEIERDRNHPAIVGWCPFNETWDEQGRRQNDEVLRLVYLATKAADPSRPCIDTSGNFHVQTDVFDLHNYEQDPARFRSYYDRLPIDGTVVDPYAARQPYSGKEPFFISEYGGIQWSEEQSGGWGYGNAPRTREEFLTRFKGLTDALLDNPRVMGLCYTQLTDVEQEQNGLYTYDRRAKFDPQVIREMISRPAAWETPTE